MTKFKSHINGQKNLIIFSPSIDHGGVEKNLFLLTEFLNKNLSDASVITSNFSDKKYFSKKINVLTPLKNFLKLKNRFLKNRKKQNYKKKIELGYRKLYRYDLNNNCQNIWIQ